MSGLDVQRRGDIPNSLPQGQGFKMGRDIGSGLNWGHF